MPAADADEVTLPAADVEGDVFGWLDEPSATASRAEAEPFGGIDLGEEPAAAEPIVEEEVPEFTPRAAARAGRC